MSDNNTGDLLITPCQVKLLPQELWLKAAASAIDVNPLNAPAVAQMRMAMADAVMPPLHLALLTQKYWGKEGVNLTVGFMDNPPADLRATILSHMNSWGKYANVKFRESKYDPQVRIARARGEGYWSYLGTDILQIGADEPTMNLEAFTMNTPLSEFYRVVRHETGHTLGFPHEHSREEIVRRIDREKAIEYFMRTQGWSEQDVIAQVLTPLNAGDINGSPVTDSHSIMCYWLPAEVMKEGQAVPGGKDITTTDADFAALIYPKPKQTPGMKGVNVAKFMAMAMNADADGDDGIEDEVRAAVKMVLSNLAGIPSGQIKDDSTLSGDLGLTSIQVRSLATPFQAIARRYKSGVKVTPAECEELETVSDCVDLIMDKIK